MKLLDGENVVYRSDGGEAGEVIVTTHRLRCGGDSDFTSIMLEEICSVAVVRVTHTWVIVVGLLLGLGAVLILASGTQDSQNEAVGLLVVGALLVVGYFVTRHSVVEVASAGAAVNFRTAGRSAESVSEFVTALESAKNQRYLIQAGKAPSSPGST